MHLERDYARLLSSLEESGIVQPVSTSADSEVQVHGLPGLSNGASGNGWRDLEAESEYSNSVSLAFPL
jgi:hypothetical protein